ncbi:TauD/TfdA family dioxygenase [Streptomyces hundungensis]|uniref:TauD/TfdA family dioxygenase n=1 Tax=Streptomyces hundungensis TaxID=1077946 RepID=UPI00340AD6A5
MPKLPDSVLSCHDVNGKLLPDSVLRYAFDQLLTNNGYVHLVNVPESFDHVAFLKEMGEFQPTPTGAVVGDLKPEAGMEDVYHAQNHRSLLPHTEGYEYEGIPPQFLALWCVTPASGPGGETTLLDSRPLLSRLTEDEHHGFLTTPYRWKSTEGLARHGVENTATHPVLEEYAGHVILRYSHNNLIVPEGDEAAVQLLASCGKLYEESHTAVSYAPRDMVVWNNWRMLHSRNAFEDPARHLKRVQIAAPIAG